MKKILYFNDNYCVCCGRQIPEGQMVCRICLENDKVVKDENRKNKRSYKNEI